MTEYTKEKPESIEALFDNIASQYDRANSVMSLNLHKVWNKEFIKGVTKSGYPERYLDLCSGTGEIAFGLLKNSDKACEAFLLDFSEQMLKCAKEKGKQSKLLPHRIHYLQADAMRIPLPSSSIDTVTIAYGIRNVQDPEKCAKEVLRVLKPGGTFAILELTEPANPVMKLGHKCYLKTFLPIIGKFFASNKEAYQYLCRSIQSFIAPDKLEDVLRTAGFSHTETKRLNLGIATIITARK